MGYSNYPDDIRCYDHDPRSPFYDDSKERAEERALEDVSDDLYTQCERLGLELRAEIEVDADEDGPCSFTTYFINDISACPEDWPELAKRLAPIDREHPDFADLVMEALEI